MNEALAWVDRHARLGDGETVDLREAIGRILLRPFVAPFAEPPVDLAAGNGYAVRAAETAGASLYNPLPFALSPPANDTNTLPPQATAEIVSGQALPAGADAVAGFELMQENHGGVEAIAAIASGTNIVRCGQWAAAGKTLITAGRALRIQEIGLLASFGIQEIAVRRRPAVRLLVAGVKPLGRRMRDEANLAMLKALIERDGGRVESFCLGIDTLDELQQELLQPGADVLLVCGRCGTGHDDVAPQALATCGTLALHGVAFAPGSSVALGEARQVPTVLLPGAPLDCLAAYDLLGGRLIRTLAGQPSALPYSTCPARVARKIVSAVGTLEFFPVRLDNGEALPAVQEGLGGLAALVRADGFLVIPASWEGYAPGAAVTVYLYEPAWRELDANDCATKNHGATQPLSSEKG